MVSIFVDGVQTYVCPEIRRPCDIDETRCSFVSNFCAGLVQAKSLPTSEMNHDLSLKLQVQVTRRPFLWEVRDVPTLRYSMVKAILSEAVFVFYNYSSFMSSFFPVPIPTFSPTSDCASFYFMISFVPSVLPIPLNV